MQHEKIFTAGMMQHPVYKTVMIGGGMIFGAGWIRSLLQHPCFDVVAAFPFRPIKERAKRAERRAGYGFRTKLHTDHIHAIDKDMPRKLRSLRERHGSHLVAAICTSTTSHADMLQNVFEAGLNTFFIDKPFLHSMTALAQLEAQIASRNGFITFPYRYNPGMQKLGSFWKNETDSHLQITYEQSWLDGDISKNPRAMGRLGNPHCSVHEIFVHEIIAAMDVGGAPVKTISDAKVFRNAALKEHENTITGGSCTFTLENGRTVKVSFSQAAKGEKKNDFRVRMVNQHDSYEWRLATGGEILWYEANGSNTPALPMRYGTTDFPISLQNQGFTAFAPPEHGAGSYQTMWDVMFTSFADELFIREAGKGSGLLSPLPPAATIQNEGIHTMRVVDAFIRAAENNWAVTL